MAASEAAREAPELRPQNVASQRFMVARRGYDPDEVEEYLRSVAAELERLIAERDALRARAEEVEERHGSADDAAFERLAKRFEEVIRAADASVRGVLDGAQEEARLTLSRVRERAEEAVEEARHRAESIIAEARRRAAEIIEAADAEAEDVRRAALAPPPAPPQADTVPIEPQADTRPIEDDAEPDPSHAVQHPIGAAELVEPAGPERDGAFGAEPASPVVGETGDAGDAADAARAERERAEPEAPETNHRWVSIWGPDAAADATLPGSARTNGRSASPTRAAHADAAMASDPKPTPDAAADVLDDEPVVATPADAVPQPPPAVDEDFVVELGLDPATLDILSDSELAG